MSKFDKTKCRSLSSHVKHYIRSYIYMLELFVVTYLFQTTTMCHWIPGISAPKQKQTTEEHRS